MRHGWILMGVLALLAVGPVIGCGGDAGPMGDAGAMDAGATDAGATDAGEGDGAAELDAGGACSGDGDCGASEYCERADGLCAGRGTCVAIPEMCSGGSEVCGCDGVTYASDCERRRAGVSKEYSARCSGTGDGSCDPGRPCPAGQYCDADTCGGLGTCREPPDPADCSPLPFRVCGCDGMTYENECFRRAAGVSQERLGECEPMECPMDAPTFCCFDDGDCPAFQHCYGATCEEGGAGVCHLDAIGTQCWGDRECEPDQRCVGVTLNACGTFDIGSPGRCE